ncbi:MAG: hypothetical protein LBS24_02010 [Clostridiales Family XIII bacterium]|jgi:hypothetical protein|nr:hypothetical protein [Clostridiales Family XIII bacterium]
MNDKLFAGLVREYFSFLRAKHGMRVENTEIAECVSFRSDVAWMEILYDRYSLFVEMGTNDGLCRASLWDVMQFATGEGKSASYMAPDEEKLRKGLRRLSDYVKIYCGKALSGDAEFYGEVQKCKEAHEKESAFRNKADHIEELAKAAWKKQEYSRVISLYGSILEHLSPTQKKRLGICRKRLGDS